MAMTTHFEGGCHCGNIALAFATETAPGDMAVRACDCAFCRKHGARTITDPRGHVRIAVADAGALVRYRFGLQTADYLLCRACRVYVAALYEDGDRAYATVNSRAFREPIGLPADALPVSYDGESAESRRARRRERWTPATLVVERK
jgi:hypothetical protein